MSLRRTTAAALLGIVICADPLTPLQPNFSPHVASRIGEASHPGPRGQPPPPDFDDPEGECDWQDEPPCMPFDDGEPQRDFPGWDEYGLPHEPFSDSEASTAAPPSDDAGCNDNNVIPPWDIGLTESAAKSWHVAEGTAGIRRSVAGWLKAKRRGLAKAKVTPPTPPNMTDLRSTYACDAYAGPISGFLFGTRNDILGYNKLGTQPQPRAIKLDELIEAPGSSSSSGSSDDTPTPPCTPEKITRRRRTTNGTRVRGRSKRWHAIRGEHLQQQILQHPSATDITSRPPAAAGLWTVDLANPSSFATATDKVLKRSAADLVMLVETKKREADTDAASNMTAKLGWRTSLSPAHATSLTGTSGGTAIASRKGLGHIPCHKQLREGFRHRLGAAWIGAVQRGGVHFITVYLKDGEGIGQTNQAILTELAAYLGTIRGPWVVGGDWNVTPQQLQAASWDQIVKGTIKHPAQATCNGKVYDFFVVSKSIEASVVAVSRLENGGFSPHSAVRMFLSGAARHKAVRRLIKPVAVKADLPPGPLPRCTNDFDPEASLADGLTSWYTRARATLLSLSGDSASSQQHAFRWEPATGKLAKKHPGASEASAILRTIVNRAREASAAHLRHGPIPQVTQLLDANVRGAKRKELTEAGVSGTTLLAWCGDMDKAVRLNDKKRTAALANTIIVKAKKLEAAEAAARAKPWREALTNRGRGLTN